MTRQAIGTSIQRKREAVGLSQVELAAKAGLSVGAVQSVEQGRHTARMDTISAIARALGTTAGELMGESDAPSTGPGQAGSPPDIVPLSALPPAVRAAMPLVVMRDVPLLGTVSAGTPIPAVEDWDGPTVQVPTDVLGDDPGFALRVHGDCMDRAGIPDGAIVGVRCVTPKAGDVALAVIDDEVVIKRLRETPDGGLELVPESTNPTHQPIRVRYQIVYLIGRVVAVVTTPERKQP